jgi:hypothetical protein
MMAYSQFRDYGDKPSKRPAPKILDRDLPYLAWQLWGVKPSVFRSCPLAHWSAKIMAENHEQLFRLLSMTVRVA